MKAVETGIAGLLILEPHVFEDDRGFFMETYNNRVFSELTGLDVDFVQDNHSRSSRNVLRGIHYQIKHAQGKLVRVTSGSVFDVAVDLRKSSPTFGQWEAFQLDDVRCHQLFIPVGFAHGFQVTSNIADVTYKCSSYYDPDSEMTIRWDDPDIGIPWPIPEPALSARDEQAPFLRDTAGLIHFADD